MKKGVRVCEEDIKKLVDEYERIVEKNVISLREENRLEEIAEIIRLSHKEILERIGKKKKNPA